MGNMRIPKPIQNLISSFERLPGIGPKSAERLTYYLLNVPQTQIEDFGNSLINLKKNTILCDICKNVSVVNPCEICADSKRDQSIIMVLEEPLDILVIEKTGKFNGLYHVLHGAINPLAGIGPDELYIDNLINRIKNNKDIIKEIIVATNPTMEGEATSMFLSRQIHELFPANGHTINVSRLGMGLPTGVDLGFADSITLSASLEGRRSI